MQQLNYVKKRFKNTVLVSTGTTKGRRSYAVPGKEALLRRVQVPDVQTKVDEREQLG